LASAKSPYGAFIRERAGSDTADTVMRVFLEVIFG
jgi:hypothetical protein